MTLNWAMWECYPQNLLVADSVDEVLKNRAHSQWASRQHHSNMLVIPKGRPEWCRQGHEEKGLRIVHASHLDHPLSPYQAWQGSVLCPHLLVWGRNFSSSQNGLRTWKWELQRRRHWEGVNKESPKTVYKSCALHLARFESPGYSRQQLMSLFNRWCLSTQMEAVTASSDLASGILPDAP